VLDCLVLGDSLAVGIGDARPECVTRAQVGINSSTYLRTILPSAPQRAAQVIISLGVNDDPSMATLENLRSLRRELHSANVVWLLPGLKDEVRKIIRTVALEHKDRVLDTQAQVGPDHLHPNRDGYRLLASWTQAGTANGHLLPASAVTYALPNRLPAQQPTFASTARRFPDPHRLGGVPGVLTVSSYNGRVVYGLWPPPGLQFGAMPPSTFAYGAFAGTGIRHH
jgi:hypothetical protein